MTIAVGETYDVDIVAIRESLGIPLCLCYKCPP